MSSVRRGSRLIDSSMNSRILVSLMEEGKDVTLIGVSDEKV